MVGRHTDLQRYVAKSCCAQGTRHLANPDSGRSQHTLLNDLLYGASASRTAVKRRRQDSNQSKVAGTRGRIEERMCVCAAQGCPTWRRASENLPSVTLLYITRSRSSSPASEYGCGASRQGIGTILSSADVISFRVYAGPAQDMMAFYQGGKPFILAPANQAQCRTYAPD